MRPMKRSPATLFVVFLAAAVLAATAFVATGCDGDEVTTTTAASTSTTPAPKTTISVVVAAPEKTLVPGETWALTETTTLSSLTIGEDATITVPGGKSVTLTVDGIEMGQVLAETAGYDLAFLPGTYTGEIVLTVADANPVTYLEAAHPFRQGIYVDASGFSLDKSVLATILGPEPTATGAEDLSINSLGDCFNGIYAAADYTIRNVQINLSGNGRSDFSGYGAAIVATGEGTTVVADGVTILTAGVARAGVVATGGASLIVKNSNIETYNGEMPEDYAPTIDTSQMRSVPWMLGLSGNVRATNLLGTGTKATYVNTRIASEGWGVLSTDDCTTPTLTAINSTIEITGEDGYGSYGIGDGTESFLGCTMNVATYATISRGSHLVYGDSDLDKVAQLNQDLALGLTAEELAALPDQPTVVDSGRFGIMWHGGGTLDISGGTVFNTKETVFLDKGQAVKITVDGSEGAQLNPANGILMQLMDDDDPGPDMTTMLNTGVYTEPTEPAEVDESHDLSRVSDNDAQAVFSNITLVGDFYNSTRGGAAAMSGGGGKASGGAGAPPSIEPSLSPASPTTVGVTPPSDPGATPPSSTFPTSGSAGATPPSATPPGAPPSVPPAALGAAAGNSRNLCLTFDKSSITGVISASTAKHQKATITAEDYRLLGVVTNTPAPAVNNGVVVVLQNGSTWTATGACYLTSLTIGEGCAVAAAAGKTLVMKVDGVETPIAPGTFTGVIEFVVQ